MWVNPPTSAGPLEEKKRKSEREGEGEREAEEESRKAEDVKKQGWGRDIR